MLTSTEIYRFISYNCYFCRLANGEGIVVVFLSVCLAATAHASLSLKLLLQVRCISLHSEGNALYPVLFSFSCIQGSVATYVRCGGMSTYRCIANFLLSLSVKEFLKSVKI